MQLLVSCYASRGNPIPPRYAALAAIPPVAHDLRGLRNFSEK